MHKLRKTALFACCLLLALPAPAAKHETWFEVRSPNFVVVSNAGEKQARKTAMQFEQIRALFRQYLTVAKDQPSPVITILAAKDEGTMRELLPEYWVKGHTRPAGIFFSNLNQFEAAVELDAQGENPYEAFYHEYYHSLTVPYFPNLPVWLAEGLADFFGNTELTDKQAHIGRPDPGLIYLLRENRLIPLNVLFKVDHSSPYYNEQNKTSIFYAESWALAHYLMIGDNTAHRAMALAYLAALQQRATPEEAAVKAFGDLGRLQKELENYINRDTFLEVTGPAPAKISDAELQSRQLSDAEVDAYRGGFEALRLRTQEAKPLLEEAVRLDPKLALAQQNLGLAQFFAGERAEALESFSRAIALDPKNPLTRYLRAYLSFNAGVKPGDPQIEDDLRQAIAGNPGFAPPYGLLATYLAAGHENLDEALAIAQKGVALEPGSASYRLALAQVLARMRRFDEAQAAAQQARAYAIDPRERASADQFLSYIQQMKSYSSGNVAGGRVTTRSDSADDSSDETSDTSPATPPSSDDSISATGVVAQVSCVGAGPRIDLDTPSGTLHLHSPAQGGLSIRVDFRPPQGFNPCTSLKGMRASVHYNPDAKGQTGTMNSVEILAQGDQAGAGTEGANRSDATPAAEPGTTATAEGQVTNVTCDGNDILLNIATAKRQFTLHARDYTRLTWDADRPSPANDVFLPCTQLKGHVVLVTFVMIEHRRYDGEMQSVEIKK